MQGPGMHDVSTPGLSQLRDVVIDGVRSALFLKPGATAFQTSLRVAVALCAVHFVASLALSYALWRGQVAFDPYGLSGDIAFYGVMLFALAILPLSLFGISAGRLFVGAIAIALTCVLTGAALTYGFHGAFGDDAAAVPFAVLWLMLAWFLAALFRLVLALAQRLRWLAAGAAMLAGLAAAYALPYQSVLTGIGAAPTPSLLQAVADLVRPPAEEPKPTTPAQPRLDVETIMHRQPALLGSEIAQLKSPEGDAPNLYFLGMAASAEQDVFKREVTAVRDLFDTRFGTAGRSMLLINHRDTVNDVPLASVSNLAAALRHLGRTMRRDKDVLVLFITSHGIKGLVSVDFAGFPLNSMPAERLALVLDKAEIRNRVLIVSACYSGSLIPILRGDTTLILTAARDDRTSFGCNNENAWTYFGDAYFNQALRTETSFISAFDKAKDTIAAWEKRDGLTPSEPQMFVGDGIRTLLDALPPPKAP